MNNTFSFKRFGLLFKKHTAENYRTYLMAVGVLIAMLFLLMGFVVFVDAGHLPPNVQNFLFHWFMLFSGSIFTSMIFAEMGDKKKAIPALTLPASHFEKFLVAWIYSFLIFQVIFVAAFYAIDFIIIFFSKPDDGQKDKIIHVFSKDEIAHNAFLLYAIVHGVVLCGAIFFEKLHYIKTSALFFGLVLTLVFMNQYAIHSFTREEDVRTLLFQFVSIREGEMYWRFDIPDSNMIYYNLTGLVVVGFLWSSAYFRLKEKEV